MAPRRYRAGKDEKRARLLREYASRITSLPEGDHGDAPMEYLCEGGRNLFAELGFPHPERELLKAVLTSRICRIVKERNLTQAEAADILGITQQQISAMKNHRLSSFSVDRLIELIVCLGQDVDITIRPAAKDHGEVSLNCDAGSRRPLSHRLRSLFVRDRDE
jgi:predicted XRE-type DNA-binding protein